MENKIQLWKKMKQTFVIVLFYFVFMSVLYAQEQYFVYDVQHLEFDKKTNSYNVVWKKDSIKLDASLYPDFDYFIHIGKSSDYLKNIDLGQYLRRNDQVGFIGLDYQRFYIAFFSSVKKTPLIYTLKGKTMVKGNICDFQGDIKIDSLVLSSLSDHSDEYSFISELYIKKYGKEEYSHFVSIGVPDSVDKEIKNKYSNESSYDGYFKEKDDSLRKCKKPYQLKYNRIRDSLMSKGYKITHAYITGRYSFKENSVQRYSGILTGNFGFEIGVCYDSIHDKIIDTFKSEIVGDRGGNFSFYGVWLSNANKTNKICTWGIDEPPYSGRLSEDSASGWFPRVEYRDKGWDTYLKCRLEGNEESCKKEKERWWDRK